MNEGDTQYTVNEVGGTGKRIISVGAYISKNEYTNIGGESITTGQTVGEIASFSSLGPTADNRMKPDIRLPELQLYLLFLLLWRYNRHSNLH